MNDMSAFLAALAANYVPPQSEEARQQTKVIAVSMTGEKLVKVDRNRKAIDGSHGTYAVVAPRSSLPNCDV